MHDKVDAARLNIVCLFPTIVFLQKNGLYSGILCDMVKDFTTTAR